MADLDQARPSKARPHASERQYVFRTLEASVWPTGVNDEAQSKAMSAYWLAFARTGDPNGDGRPAWPAFEAKGDQIVDFTNQGPVAKTTPDAAVLDAIGRPAWGAGQTGRQAGCKAAPDQGAAARKDASVNVACAGAGRVSRPSAP